MQQLKGIMHDAPLPPAQLAARYHPHHVSHHPAAPGKPFNFHAGTAPPSLPCDWCSNAYNVCRYGGLRYGRPRS